MLSHMSRLGPPYPHQRFRRNNVLIQHVDPALDPALDLPSTAPTAPLNILKHLHRNQVGPRVSTVMREYGKQQREHDSIAPRESRQVGKLYVCADATADKDLNGDVIQFGTTQQPGAFLKCLS